MKALTSSYCNEIEPKSDFWDVFGITQSEMSNLESIATVMSKVKKLLLELLTSWVIRRILHLKFSHSPNV
jgi:hypothetical protein